MTDEHCMLGYANCLNAVGIPLCSSVLTLYFYLFLSLLVTQWNKNPH